jgi:uncharacterized membrane protein YidH (DUF202 family)
MSALSSRGWRTAIAVIAFGFLVEKFDLFLELSAPGNDPGQRIWEE